jgi:hypothetical protein
MLKRLTVFTERYEKIMRTYLRSPDSHQWAVTSEGKEGRTYFIRLMYAPDGRFTDTLAAMLEEATAMENPVYKCSQQMMSVARDLRGAPIHAEDVKQLAEFLRLNSALNIEGYVAFRMAEYSYRLDLTAYGLIKKLQAKS